MIEFTYGGKLAAYIGGTSNPCDVYTSVKLGDTDVKAIIGGNTFNRVVVDDGNIYLARALGTTNYITNRLGSNTESPNDFSIYTWDMSTGSNSYSSNGTLTSQSPDGVIAILISGNITFTERT